MLCMKVVNRKSVLVVLVSFFLIVFMGFIFATTTTINSPVLYGNYSTTINLTATTDLDEPLNVTFYYNSSGGFAGLGSSILTTIVNTTASQTNFNDTSFDISSLSSLSTYNFSAYVDNGTDQQLSVSAANVTIDNTPPNVTLLTIPASSGTYAGSIVLNVTVNDVLIGMGTVFFNVTNSSGVEVANYTASNEDGVYYNATLDTTGFTDGTYNITVWANDSLNNLNRTTIASNVIFDNTAPVVTLTSSSSTANSLTLTIGIIDISSATCTADRTGATVSGTTLTESGLTCVKDYSYVVTCVDDAGNSGVSSSTSFTTASCDGGSGGSSSSAGSSWSATHSVLATEMSDGSARLLMAKQRAQFSFDGSVHHVGVKSISDGVASVEIASTPVSYDFEVGDERKFDLNGDGIYDLYVKLNSIDGGVANLFIKFIDEEDSFDEVVGVDAIPDEDGAEDDMDDGGFSWTIWIVVIVIVVVVVLFTLPMMRKKSNIKGKNRKCQ